jgi:glutathione synthase/RimK-type ligase-like ATP-grasp enzyme
MIACLYGRVCAPFVETAVRDLCRATLDLGGKMEPVAVETAMEHRERYADVRQVYVMPFDAPRGTEPAALVRSLFPRAQCLTSFAAQDLCWDKIATQERLVDRGVPVPDTLITSDPAELRDFVRRNDFVILKERMSCGGLGHIVLWLEDGRLVGDSGSHQYEIDLAIDGRRQLREQRLRYPAPFYAQRLIAGVRDKLMVPGQVLRAYVVDSEVRFWTERYRDRYERPSDWIVNVHRGAKYRFVLNVSEEMKKVAVRSAEVVGAPVAAVDMIRTGSMGPYVLEVDTDSHHMLIDRQFKNVPDYREFFDLDQCIAELLVREAEVPEVRTLGIARRSETIPRRGERLGIGGRRPPRRS